MPELWNLWPQDVNRTFVSSSQILRKINNSVLFMGQFLLISQLSLKCSFWIYFVFFTLLVKSLTFFISRRVHISLVLLNRNLSAYRCWLIIELNGIPDPTFAIHTYSGKTFMVLIETCCRNASSSWPPSDPFLYKSFFDPLLNLAVDTDMSLAIIEMWNVLLKASFFILSLQVFHVLHTCAILLWLPKTAYCPKMWPND